MLIDMGDHVLKTWPEAVQLHQVLVPGLEDRARLFPALSTYEQTSPGPVLSSSNSLKGLRQAMQGAPNGGSLGRIL